jgi:perosamine synthetase
LAKYRPQDLTILTDAYIPLSTPWLGGREKEYLVECIDTGWVAAGPYIRRFEEYVSGYLGAPDCVAVSSGTAALHVAMRLLDVGPGDEVICPSLTFVATTNAITHTGARPAFIDSQPETWGMDPLSLRRFLEEECERDSGRPLVDRVTKRPVKAVLVVHLFGHPVDMDQILEVAREYGLPVIEDATESLGSLYKGKPTGTLGLLGCLSFNGNKTVTSGGGGMVVSEDIDLLRRARYLINQAHDDSMEFLHSEVGYNYRLSNLHAAVGLAQVERLDEFISARRSIAELYTEAFSEVPGITFFQEQPWARSNYWLSTVKLDPESFPVSPEEVAARMRSRGIEVRRPFVPNHRLPPFKGERAFGELPVAVSLYQQGLNLPSSAWLKPEQVERITGELLSIGSNG